MSLTNNDTFRRLRYALDLRDEHLSEIFELIESPLEQEAIGNLLKKETDPGYVECADETLGAFLDGLILKRRGKKEGLAPRPKRETLSNNDVLKKLRIALELKEEDMIAILGRAEVTLSGAELSALFRQAGHKNFKACGDQFLRNFLTGLKGYAKAN